MKDYKFDFELDNKKYTLVFNLNVMEKIQQEYKTLDNWGGLTDGKNGEPNARAVIFGFTEMINEGIDIQNEDQGTKEPFLTTKQVGRIITEYGLREATTQLNNTVIASTQTTEKN